MSCIVCYTTFNDELCKCYNICTEGHTSCFDCFDKLTKPRKCPICRYSCHKKPILIRLNTSIGDVFPIPKINDNTNVNEDIKLTKNEDLIGRLVIKDNIEMNIDLSDFNTINNIKLKPNYPIVVSLDRTCVNCELITEEINSSIKKYCKLLGKKYKYVLLDTFEQLVSKFGENATYIIFTNDKYIYKFIQPYLNLNVHFVLFIPPEQEKEDDEENNTDETIYIEMPPTHRLSIVSDQNDAFKFKAKLIKYLTLI